MKRRLFGVQDSTQTLRVLAIIAASSEPCEDYLVIHTTKTKKNSADFIKALATLASIHNWAGITVIPDYKIGDFSDEYFRIRSTLARDVEQRLASAFGSLRYDEVYTCRNYQVGNDLLLTLYGMNAKKICFGDDFGSMDIFDDPKWQQFDELSAIIPRMPVEGTDEKRCSPLGFPLTIVDKAHVLTIAKLHTDNISAQLDTFIGSSNNNAVLVPLTPMTEAGMTKSAVDEVQFYLDKILLNRHDWLSNRGIDTVIIKPHPRQCHGQAAALEKALANRREFQTLRIFRLESGLLQYAPIELIAPALNIKYIDCPAISASILTLNGLYGTPYSSLSMEDILSISIDWRHKYFIEWLTLTTSLNQIKNWDKRSFINGCPPKFGPVVAKDNTRKQLVHQLEQAAQLASNHEYTLGVAAIEDEIARIKNSKKSTSIINAGNNDLKITFVAYGPSQINGPNIWLQRLLPQLAARGFKPHVIFLMNSNDQCPVIDNLEANGIPCTLLPAKQHVEHNIVDILAALQHDPPDLFIPNLSVPAYYAAKWVKAAGIPTVGILHSDDPFHHELINAFVSRGSDFLLSAVVCVSHFIESLAKAEASPEVAVIHCPYGVEIPAFTCAPPGDILKLVYTGRLIQRQKRIFDVITATKTMLAHVPGVEAAFFGEDREQGKAIKTIDRLSAKAPMHYGGVLPFNDILKTLAQHHAFMLLSDYEGISIALMEAMACGLVPVCTRIESGTPDIIRHGENGILIDNRGSDFVEAIRRLKEEDGLWTRLSKNARNTIEKEYSIEVCAARWADFLTTLHNQATSKRDIAIPKIDELGLPPVKQTINGMCREDNRLPRPHADGRPEQTSHDDFLNPSPSPQFMDLYFVRQAIKSSLEQAIPLFSGVLLDVGCGQMPYRDHILGRNPAITRYVGLDFASGKYAERRRPDLTWDGRAIPLSDGGADCAMATEVLEHCPDPLPVLREIRRVLAPGGVLFFTTPFLWPIHDAPHDHYRYTPYALQRLLEEAGFEDARVEALGGWNASLAQMLGLWLRRAPMADQDRARLTRELFPFYTELVRTDVVPTDFSRNPMITGLAGTARASAPRAAQTPPAAGPRVIVITDQFPVLSQTFILEQITGLIDRGLAVEHWSLQRMDEPVVHDKARRYGLLEATRYVVLPPEGLRADPARWTQAFLRTNALAPLDNVAAVQIHFGPNFDKFAPLFAACPNLFTVVSFHGYDGSATLRIKGPDVYAALFARADRITTPSVFMKDALIRHGCPPEKLVIHHYGKDVAAFAPPPRPDGRRPTRLLTVARFVEKKGLEYALAAFAKARAGLDVEYRIVGYGPLAPALEALARELGVADKVRFLGQLTNDAVRQEMTQADVFALTSVTASNGDQEGVPVSLIEAQALGLPVISSRHAGIPELVVHGETGFLAAERDVDEIAGYMRALFKNPAIRATFAANARERVLREFDLDRLNDALADLLLGRGPESALPAPDGREPDATAPGKPGKTPYFCPICRSRLECFRPFGTPPRPGALCPNCTSLERHRALWLFLERHTNLRASPDLRLLHFAPEACLEPRFRQLLGKGYVTADLLDPRAGLRADITNLPFSEASFDLVYCSHVLEHVPDDGAAMRELHRVLVPDGLAVIMVPLAGEVTQEDLSIIDPVERTRRYGQADHVRYYGLDITDRLAQAGFAVTLVETAKVFPAGDIEAMRLGSERIFLCRKAAAGQTDGGKTPSRSVKPADADQALQATARHWSTAVARPRTRWWMHPGVLRHLNALVCGSPLEGPWAGLARRMAEAAGGKAFGRALSVGCGSASKELNLLEKGIVEHFDLFEISSRRVAQGQALAERLGLAGRADFHELDALAQDLDDGYDLVYWNNALHHMFDVDSALAWSRERLRPGGHFVMDDFVGATRFQWPDEQLAIAGQVRRRLPERLLRDPEHPKRLCPVDLTRPDLANMLAQDPSEAADSDNILPALGRVFPQAQILLTGGVVYNLALKDIIANFDPVQDAPLLQELLDFDAQLAARGQTHYACAFAVKPADAAP